MLRKLKTTSLYIGLSAAAIWTMLTNFSLTESPEEPAFISMESTWAQEKLASLSTREKIAQFFMLAAYSNRDEAHLLDLERQVKENKVGGFIFFQGKRKATKDNIARLQALSSTPLLIGMDAEWGAAMRLRGMERFPYQMTLGAANSEYLSGRVGERIASELKNLGVHINFAPVVDINSNPDNPVIGFRSFGENPIAVSKLGDAFANGLEKEGVMACLKHFPGHGDTDVDSHKGLPTILHTKDEIMLRDLMPFKYGFNNGASSVMIAHLNIPALDSTGTPASLSKTIVTELLKNKMKYKGLVISDALNMKGVADFYGKTEVVVKAFKAGIDVLLFPESVEDAIAGIEKEVMNGNISIEEINARCLKILKAKAFYVNKKKNSFYSTSLENDMLNREVYRNAVTLVKNDGIFPIRKIDSSVALVNIGTRSFEFTKRFKDYCEADIVTAYSGDEALKQFNFDKDYKRVYLNIYATSMLSSSDFHFPINWRSFLAKMDSTTEVVLNVFGNPYVLKENFELADVHALILSYENNPTVQDISAQAMFGAIPFTGSLPVNINQEIKLGAGEKTEGKLRLSFVLPEELGISRLKLREIDRIVEDGIREEAFPGCQIVVAKDGQVFYQKSFGHHTYSEKTKVEDNHIYDLASITKIASSTLGLMGLESQEKFDLNKSLNDYLPELVGGTSYSSIVIREMMAHQAGLKSWIPFYTATLDGGNWNPEILSDVRKLDYNTQVANGMFIRDDYADKVYERILKEPLNSKRYKYSDLGYYFVKKIIEKQSGQSLNGYVEDNYYSNMGLPTMGYLPLLKYDEGRIIPTENDVIFRKQLVKGYVHDPGAAMLGGVGGHAGLFSNATDLAALMQMYLNGGEYAGQQFVDKSVIERYTDCQYCPSNRRGAGFDKPVRDLKGGPTCELVSLKSFGHSGFTGTLSWADPNNGVNYVFLSNRVYPDAENWKLVRMDIRTKIQRVIYEAVNEAEVN